MNFIGMDIHKQFTVAVVKDGQGNKIAEDKFDNTESNFISFLQPYPSNETRIVIESTCVWEYIYEILEANQYEVKLANPIRTRAIAEARIKTDSVDASTLADLLRANLISESYIPPKEVRRLREITRERRTFVKQTTQIKNKIHAILIKRGVKMPTATLCSSTLLWIEDKFKEDDVILHYINLLKYHTKELELIDENIRNLSEKEQNARLLMTIPGIAGLRALDIVAEIGEIKRFPTADKLCSYAGLVPSIKQSGNTLRFGRLIQQSSRNLKRLFVEISWNIVRTRESNHLKDFYKKLVKKKGKQKAICAVARKLCCVVYAILKNQEGFRYS